MLLFWETQLNIFDSTVPNKVSITKVNSPLKPNNIILSNFPLQLLYDLKSKLNPALT